ncbi:asparagine synthase-related protein [Brevundimonas sp.]|uniref:asparagine synthase-related protein n=1 Tax=Brevundimonas sp. TaxID=1871086 RepID=UPI002899A918|nr:asparagine synthase-related protein [Brevundimonas sp.]
MDTTYLAVLCSDAGLRRGFGDRLRWVAGPFKADSRGDLTLFTAMEASTLDLGPSSGMLVGALFSRETRPRRLSTIDEPAGRRIAESGGASLATDFWGGYVAFTMEKGSRAVRILRDPSGTVPCYYLKVGSALIASSSVALLFAVAGVAPEIQWPHARRYLATASLRTSETALAGVKEVLPGFGLSIRNGSEAVITFWSPWDFVDPELHLSDQERQTRLYELVQGCIAAWASCFDRILVGVSGGLDSSIVAACLAQWSGRTQLMTMATHSASGDERAYARILAASLELPLQERFYEDQHIDLDDAQAKAFPRPAGLIFDQSYQRTIADVADATSADAIFSGSGGDNIFCYMSSATPLVDHFLSGGAPGPLWRTLDDICRLNGCSIWSASAMALRRLARASSRNEWPVDVALLAKDKLSVPGDHLHPWVEPPRKVLPGKVVHVWKLLRAYSVLDVAPIPGGPMRLAPLQSQPIMEFCLGIPTWKWCEGGMNRSVARAAFARALPREILHRRIKRGPTSFSIETVERHRLEIRDRLIPGLLASNGVLDNAAVETALSVAGPIDGETAFRLCQLTAAEAWARSWSAQPSRPRLIA